MGEATIFAKRMKEAREKCKLKQNILALKVGVTPQTISAYENAETDGKGKNPTLENAVAIANVLNVSLDWLCGRDVHTAVCKETLGDIARDIVSFEKTSAGIYLDTSSREEFEYGPDLEHPNPRRFDVTYPAIVFTNEKLCHFVNEWKKIKNLHDTGTIDDELYNLWLDKHLSLLDDTSAIDKPKELDEDGELPF